MRSTSSHLLRCCIALFTVAALGATVYAQPNEGRGPGRRGPRPGFGPPPSPLMAALDADKDGVLSAKEIENAVAALKSLDKDGNGKLEGQEIAPPRPRFAGRGPQGGPGDFIARIMERDKNKNGKIDADEFGDDRMAGMLNRADTDEDGAVTKEELEKMIARFRGRGGRGGGRPGQGQGRPQRPAPEE